MDSMANNNNNNNNNNATSVEPFNSVQLPQSVYITGEIIVGLFSILGNALIIYVFFTNKRLRVYRNYYILGLAVADFLVGLIGIPLAILASLGLPKNLYGCLFTCSIIVVFCAISILCLVAVSIDRFWATFNPLSYYKSMNSRIVCAILLGCVILGSIIGFLPLFGWYNHSGWAGDGSPCVFVFVIDYDYLAFVYFAIIVLPAIIMAGFYGYIYRFIISRTRMKRQAHNNDPSRPMIQPDTVSKVQADNEARDTEKKRKKEARAGKKLSSIIIFFLICWMPLNTMNCVKAFCDTCNPPIIIIELAIILSHTNSAINPFLYAYHLQEFRIAMKNTLSKILTVITFGYFEKRVPQPITNTSQSQSAV